MRHINTKSSGLGNHMSVYNRVDARMDNRHVPERELGRIVREVREERERHVPLRRRIRVA